MALKLFDGGTCAATSPTALAAASRCEDSLVERWQDLEGLVETLFVSWLGSPPLMSRRSHRVPHHQPLALTPLDDATLEPNGVTQRVAAWDLSSGGLSFLHQNTLVCRIIAITFGFPSGDFRSVLTRLKWCRFTRNGRYRSGGQFLRTIAPPRDAEVDFDLLPAG